MKRDPLGRPYRPDPDPPEVKHVLSDDEITTIATDVRTKPLTEVGRHVMPLIQHIVGLDMRQCSNCRFWVPYNFAEAPSGECTHPVTQGVEQQGVITLGVRLLTNHREDGAPAPVAFMTAFDWACKGWEESQAKANDARCCNG